MRTLTWLVSILVFFFCCAAPGQEAVVSNVTFAQFPSGSGTQVDVYYDLASPGGNCTITARLSKDNGASFPFPITTATGDIGSGVASGMGKHIVWHVGTDYPNETIPQARIRILADVYPADPVYAIGTHDITYTDPSRGNRSITCRIRYPGAWSGPDAPVAGGPGVRFPVVVFGHGWLTPVNDYTYLWNQVVPAGYIMIMVDTETGALPDQEEFARDMAFVVDSFPQENTNPASLFYGKVGQGYATSGHSMGGGAAIVAVQYSANIDAIVTLAAAENSAPVIEGAALVTQPALTISAASDCMAVPGDHQIPMYNAMPSVCKYFVSIVQGSHCQFCEDSTNCMIAQTGLCFGRTYVDRGTQEALTGLIMIHWLDIKLKGRQSRWLQFDPVLNAYVQSNLITYAVSCSQSGIGLSAAGLLETVSPALISFVAEGPRTAIVTFNEDMWWSSTGAPANYTISGEVGTLSANPTSVASIGGNAYRLTWASGEMFNGGSIHLIVAGVQDGRGNFIGAANNANASGIGIPPTGTILINGGAALTSSRLVDLTLSASDAHSSVAAMAFSSDGLAWTSWEPFQVSRSWTLVGDDGPLSVYVRYRDGAGNLSTGVISASISLDTTPPTGSVLVNGGAALTKNLDVSLVLTYGDGVGSGVSEMQFRNAETAWTAWEPVAAMKAWTLSPGDGTKDVYVQFRDVAGNVSTDAITDAIVLDTTPPDGTLVINAGAEYTTSIVVTLTLAYGDGAGSSVAEVQFGNTDTIWSGWQPVAPTKPWTLFAGDGSKVVHVQYRDVAGNVSTSSITDGITLDTAPPGGTLVINGGTGYTNSRDVTLSLAYDDGAGSGAIEMQFSNSGVSWSGWEPVAATKAWTMSSGSGIKTVYAQYRDRAGNASVDTISDTIVLDTTPPTGTLVINGGAGYTNTLDVTLSLSYTDGPGSGVTDVQFRNGASAWSGWEPAAATKAWTLAPGDGIKTVYAQFRDTAGNVSTNTISDTITVDTAQLTASIALASPTETGADTITFTVTFNKPVSPTFTAADVSVAGTLAGSVFVGNLDPTYNVFVTLSDANADGVVGITLGTDVMDGSGNHYDGGSSPLCHVYNWRGFVQQPQGAVKYTGESHTFAVMPDCGASAISYQWKWDDGVNHLPLNGPPTPTWMLSDLTPASRGEYWCEVSYDGVVHESDYATLSVEEHLEIVQQPSGGEAQEGDQFAFEVVATGGHRPLRYQWSRDGIPISGTSAADYVIASVQISDLGTYAVEVADASTDVRISETALLVVGQQTMPSSTPVGLAILVCGMALVFGAAFVRLRAKRDSEPV